MAKTNFRQFVSLSLFFILIVTGLASFWIFSRFTVDDAFISWRYGKNLVDFGIWNYNPSYLDLTWAYTNPISAIVSIIPNFLKLDIVLFFSMISIMNYFLFMLWIKVEFKQFFIIALIPLVLPFAIIHLFSGLETFFFVTFSVVFFVNLYEKRLIRSIIYSIILIFVRPEAWLLTALVPIYYLLLKEDNLEIKSLYDVVPKIKLNKITEAVIIAIVVGMPLIIFLIIHWMYFGYFLPNTFYIKNTGFIFINTSIEFAYHTLLLVPLLMIFIIKLFNKMKYNDFLYFTLIAMYFGTFAIQYSLSSLAMNYADRFGFHIFIPMYFILIYVGFVGDNKELFIIDSNKENIVKFD